MARGGLKIPSGLPMDIDDIPFFVDDDRWGSKGFEKRALGESGDIDLLWFAVLRFCSQPLSMGPGEDAP